MKESKKPVRPKRQYNDWMKAQVACCQSCDENRKVVLLDEQWLCASCCDSSFHDKLVAYVGKLETYARALEDELTSGECEGINHTLASAKLAKNGGRDPWAKVYAFIQNRGGLFGFTVPETALVWLEQWGRNEDNHTGALEQE